jgi:hypothetical protein
LSVATARLNPATLNYATTQPLRGGISVSIPLTNSNPSAGTLTSATATILGGNTNSNTGPAFNPEAAGEALLAITTPAGFTTPSDFQQITATVTAPGMSINSATVGRDLQVSVPISLAVAPPSPVTVTVTGSNGLIATITKDGTVEGGTSLTFTNVTTTNVGSIFVQGRSLGTATVTVQAPGYTSDAGTVTVDPSGFVFITDTLTTTAGAANSAVRVDLYRLHPTTLNTVVNQDLRGGLTASVGVTSANPAVGTIVNGTVVFSPGDSFRTTAAFDPQAAGTTTINLTQPPGFSIPSNLQQIGVVVNP